MKNNPNHWCSKASSELFNNQYKRYAAVGGISGELFPMYCKIDENVEKYPCQTQLVLENNFTNTNELVYEGPSKNVYIGRISSVPYDPSGNIPYTSTSSPIKTSITSLNSNNIKVTTNYNETDKYSTQIVNNSNYLNCEEVARLISRNKNWDINNVDYNGKKIVFTSSCS